MRNHLYNVYLSLLTCVLYNIRFVSLPNQDGFLNLWPLCFVVFVPLLVVLLRTKSLMLSLFHSILAFSSTATVYGVSTIEWSVWPGALGVGVGFGILFSLCFHYLMRTESYSARNIIYFGIAYAILVDCTIVEYIGTLVLAPIGLARFPLLLQPLRLFGYSSLEFVLGVVNLVCALGFLKINTGCKLVGVLAVSWFAVAFYLQHESNGGQVLRVGVVSTGGRRFNDTEFNALNIQLVNGGAEIAVWPEVYIREASEEDCRNRLSQILSRGETFPRHAVYGCGEGDINIALLVSEGIIVGIYGKQHTVWEIGEVNTVNHGYPVYNIATQIGSISVSMLICYDIDFPKSFEFNTDLVLIPSFDLHSPLRNHYWAAQFRAAESGIPIAKADLGWDSALISRDGRLVRYFESKDPQVEVLIGDVVVGRREYSWLGLLLGLTVLFGSVAIAQRIENRSIRSSRAISRSRSPVLSRNSITRV